jgi:hypothetical protein
VVVTFNGLTAIATSWSDTQIVASIPTGGITEPVVVMVNGAASNGSTYIVYFTLTTSISPSPGPGGLYTHLYRICCLRRRWLTKP